MKIIYRYVVKGTDIGYDSPTRGEVTVFGKFTTLEAAKGHLGWEINQYYEKADDESIGDVYSGGTVDDGIVLVQWNGHVGEQDGKTYGMKFEIEEIEPETEDYV